ncbi:MAG: tetratricopeptide repeat protein, partial [Desulfococcaceae bacterium]
MINENQHIEALKNAARDPVSALTAVEVDTQHRADALVKILQQELSNRPNAVLPFLCSQSPALLLDQARQAISDWTKHEGVLFIADQGDADEKDAHQFWTEMNFLRESWGGLKCHVIFFLLPLNYRAMIRDADHLADWIPLKLHILGISEDDAANLSYQMRDSAFSENEMSFETARQVLSGLQEQLSEAVHQGVDKSLLVRRYYLPMFEAAMTIYDLQRAQSLRRHISESDIKETELPEWLYKNYELDSELRNFDEAEKSIKRLLDWAKEKNEYGWEASSCHSLGRIAQERRDFEAAEKWYRKSLEISEKHGNEHGAASTYHQLGMIAEERRD